MTLPSQYPQKPSGWLYPWDTTSYGSGTFFPPSPPPRSRWKYWLGGVFVVLLLINAVFVGFLLWSVYSGQTLSPSPSPTPVSLQTCTLHLTDHLMTMTITGPTAFQDCYAILDGDASNFLGQVGINFYREGIYLDRYLPDEHVVCDFSYRGRRITIRDGGGLYYGTEYCQELGQ
jgi:hypothetical protein